MRDQDRSRVASAMHVADVALGHLRAGLLDNARALRAPRSCRSAPHVAFVANDPDRLAGSQLYAARWRDDLVRHGFCVETMPVLAAAAHDRDAFSARFGAIVTWGDAVTPVLRRFFGWAGSPALVALTGNVPECRRDPAWLADLVVCSTETAVRSWLPDDDTPLVGGSAVVLHPPVADRYFAPPVRRAEQRAVMQVNMSKRPELFEALARAMPETPFIAVRGAYGAQVVPQLPNVTPIGPGPDAPFEAMLRSRVLISPVVESYGLAAAEATAMGLAVVARDCAGIREAALGRLHAVDSGCAVDAWALAVADSIRHDQGLCLRARDRLAGRQSEELARARRELAAAMESR